MNAKWAFKYVRLFLAVTGLALAVACGGGTAVVPVTDQNITPSPAAALSPPTETTSPLPGAARKLAAGEFQLPAANAFGEPGFHEVLTATHNLPSDLGRMTGLRLVLKLWDAGRPNLSCNREHPLSGCATVDWSDAIGRPNVPPEGVFDNRITFQFATGVHSFFLSESGALNDKPDAFKPS